MLISDWLLKSALQSDRSFRFDLISILLDLPFWSTKWPPGDLRRVGASLPAVRSTGSNRVPPFAQRVAAMLGRLNQIGNLSAADEPIDSLNLVRRILRCSEERVDSIDSLSTRIVRRSDECQAFWHSSVYFSSVDLPRFLNRFLEVRAGVRLSFEIILLDGVIRMIRSRMCRPGPVSGKPSKSLVRNFDWSEPLLWFNRSRSHRVISRAPLQPITICMPKTRQRDHFCFG